jgi:hypothetical protein
MKIQLIELIHSNICITDYSFNVARFIKLANNSSNNIFNSISVKIFFPIIISFIIIWSPPA